MAYASQTCCRPTCACPSNPLSEEYQESLAVAFERRRKMNGFELESWASLLFSADLGEGDLCTRESASGSPENSVFASKPRSPTEVQS